METGKTQKPNLPTRLNLRRCLDPSFPEKL